MPYQSNPGTEDDETIFLVAMQRHDRALQRQRDYNKKDRVRDMRRRYYQDNKARINEQRKKRMRDNYYARHCRYTYHKARRAAEGTDNPQTDDG